MQFTTTILALLAATSALAAPVEPINNSSLQARKVGSNKSTCDAYRNDMININESVFKVTIGRPYLGGGRCKEIRSKMNKIADVDYLKCTGASGKANTKLIIHSDMSEKNIANMNKALHKAYPEIKFNCPTSIANP